MLDATQRWGQKLAREGDFGDSGFRGRSVFVAAIRRRTQKRFLPLRLLTRRALARTVQINEAQTSNP